MIDESVFSELFNMGYFPLPLLWDESKREAIKHPEHDTNKIEITLEYVQSLYKNGFGKTNGIALKLKKPLIFLDFDVKNAKNKNVYWEWFNIISNTNEDILKKVCIESTKSDGFHVYAKYDNIDSKLTMARNSEGHEVISVYAGELLSYCYPTPGYKLVHNDFNDIDFLTEDEFNLLVTTAAFFNEDAEFKPGTPTVQVLDYPIAFENTLIQFDTKCTDEMFEGILNDITLFRVKNDRYNKNKWVPFLRKGSTGSYSAKAYFHSKRLLIFSASLKGFPNWHDSAKMGDTRWSLTPSLILYYKNKRSWHDTVEEIKIYSESGDLDITETANVTSQPAIPVDRLKFPYDVFPESIQNFIFGQRIQHEYLAGSILVALSTAIGNSIVLQANDGYKVKPILYMAIVAPPGASKSPALKITFSPLESFDAKLYESYSVRRDEYKKQLATYEKDKKAEKPEKPNFLQTLIKDATIEMAVQVLSHNINGCCVLADELSGFLNRMNQYKTGDEVQKWLEMWSGSPILLQRITREENKVQEPFCNIIGGIQPGVLESLSKADNEHNGFYHRFLFVYPEPQKKLDWDRSEVPYSVKRDFNDMFSLLLSMRENQKSVYVLSDEANLTYKDWYKTKNAYYNKATSDHVKGVIAKYQDYCLRFALLLQVIYDGRDRRGVISRDNIVRGIQLTEYFSGNMIKAMKKLAPDTPVDKLSETQEKLYKALPECFTTKTATTEGKKLGMKDNTIKSFLLRGIEKKILTLLERGKYEKMYQ